MSKARQFIKDCTRRCSNVVYYHNRNFTHGTDYVEGSGIEVQYSPWLTPEQALRAVEIEREAQEEKLSRVIELADAMYYAAQMITTDAFHLRKATEAWWQFKNVILNNKE